MSSTARRCDHSTWRGAATLGGRWTDPLVVSGLVAILEASGETTEHIDLKREKHREFRTGFCRALSGQT